LPKNSIDSWAKCKDAFIGRYYPPAKIIALCSDIMKFSQFDNEHVAQAWERMKSMIKNFPTHGLTTWMIVQAFYAGLNFSSRNLLDSAAGGTFMSLTLGAATKLLDNIMVNYSEWHTERAPQVSWEFRDSSHGDGLTEGLDGVRHQVRLGIVPIETPRFTQVQGPPRRR
jgi:hypothetical protein